MRLLFATTDFPPAVGGTQTYACQLASRLHGRCRRLTVVAPAAVDSSEWDDALPYSVVRTRGSSSAFPFTAASVISRLGRNGAFDAVFCSSWQAAFAARAARPLGGPDVILLAAHGRELLINPLEKIALLGTAYDAARRFGLHSADRYFPVSRHTRDLLIRSGADRSRIQVLPNGADPDLFRPVEAARLRKRLGAENRQVVLSVGRLVRRKGIDRLLHALPEILRHHPDVLYIVVGDGPDRDRLTALTRHLNLDNNVLFVGTQPHNDLCEWYSLCDVFVLPVRELARDVEGFGLVFLEASACARPVVGTCSGGVPDAIVDGETGLLVSGESPFHLAETVCRILDNPELAQRLGSGGRRRVVTRANWDTVASTLYGSIQAVLSGVSGHHITTTRPRPRPRERLISFFRF